MRLLGGLAVMLVAAGVIAALLGVLIAPRGKAGIWAGLGFMLDLWLAAGLLQLTGEPRWSTVGTSAILLALRVLLRAQLGEHQGSGAAPLPP